MRLPFWHGRQRHQCECAEAVAAALPCYNPPWDGAGGLPHIYILTYARFMVPIFIGSLSVFSVRFGRRDARARNDMVAYLIGNSFCAVLLNITIAKL